jgi:hypothetical protein
MGRRGKVGGSEGVDYGFQEQLAIDEGVEELGAVSLTEHVA